jgi:sentrin-specific protease 1
LLITRAVQVEQSLRDRQFKRVLISAEVLNPSLQRLKPQQWLNDEVVNYYIQLLSERSEGKFEKLANGSSSGQEQEQGIGRKVHVFNSFFYAKLEEQGYEKARLKRWTKKVSPEVSHFGHRIKG